MLITVLNLLNYQTNNVVPFTVLVASIGLIYYYIISYNIDTILTNTTHLLVLLFLLIIDICCIILTFKYFKPPKDLPIEKSSTEKIETQPTNTALKKHSKKSKSHKKDKKEKHKHKHKSNSKDTILTYNSDLNNSIKTFNT